MPRALHEAANWTFVSRGEELTPIACGENIGLHTLVLGDAVPQQCLSRDEEGGAARVRKGINVDRLFLPIGVLKHQVPPPRYWLRTRDELIGRPTFVVEAVDTAKRLIKNVVATVEQLKPLLLHRRVSMPGSVVSVHECNNVVRLKRLVHYFDAAEIRGRLICTHLRLAVCVSRMMFTRSLIPFGHNLSSNCGFHGSRFGPAKMKCIVNGYGS